MGSNANITVIGSYAVGMSAVTDKFPVKGETKIGRNFALSHGGKGSNQAIAAARSGGKVYFGGCIGSDEFGENAIKLYKEEKINYDYLKHSNKYSTGVGLIFVDGNGENMIVIDLGANNDIFPEDIAKMEDVIKNSSILLMQLEIEESAVVSAAKIARKNGVRVILNPAPYKPMSRDLLENIDIFTPNETEARAVVGLDSKADISDEELADRILKMGVKTVIITLGERGAYIANKNMKQYVPSKKVNAVDTTGAGDTFSGALSVAVSEGKDLVEAVKFASAAAGISVTKYGVVEAIPYRDEVEKFLKGDR